MSVIINGRVWCVARNQIEWVCDKCRCCGDDACSNECGRLMYREQNTDNALCSNCLEILGR